MRLFTIAALALLLQGTVLAQSAAPSRVEYVRFLQATETRKLLGMGGNRLYVARKSGQVDVLDAGQNGQVLFSLQDKDAEGRALLGQAEAVAVSEDTVYVVDSDENRVVMYGLDGKFKGRFGGRSSEGGLSSPQGITFASGIVYVADTGNRRIQMYGDNGVFLATLPINSAPANKGIDEQKVAYKLDKPAAVAVDAQGQIYVLDASGGLFSDKSQVKVYAQDGSHLRLLPKNGKPVALQMAHDGVYVVDAEGYAVQKYDASGRMVSYFGSRGDGRAQFMSLSGLALAGTDVYVGDRERGLVHHFRTGAAPASALTPRQTAVPYVRWQQSLNVAAGRMAWDGKDTLLAVAREKSALLRIKDGAAQEMPLKDLNPTALAFDKAGALWVLERNRARLHKLDAAGNPVLTVGSSGSRNGQLDSPNDFVIASDGSLYVADSGNGRIQGFSADGVFFKLIDKGLREKLSRPAALALDAQDQLYVLDTSRNAITVYSAAGEPLREFGNDPAREAEKLSRPVALLATQEELFVLDSDRVRVYSFEGRQLRSFAAPGKENGELSEADAFALRDASSFYIAERGSPRVQLFSTQYKPRAPQQLVAQPAVHAVELRWAASPLAYVKQYQVYRAGSEAGPFVRIGSSPSAQYIDAQLKPDETFHYRVAAATATGDEGLPGPVVAGAALKYTPPPLQEVKAEATTARVRLSWKALDAKLVTGYVVYQKEGEKFTKLGETTTPEFQRDNLNPGTAYTFWLAARSVDGVESEKQAVAASTLADNRAPLEIDAGQLHNVFSNSYKLYEKDGVGAIKLSNNTRSTMNDIKVSFVLNNFMDFPTEQRIPSLEPGASREVVLKAVFNNNILTLTEDTPVQAKLEASYFENGQPRVYSQIKTINIYDKHRMGWDERGRYAAFVTPKDPLLINFSRSVASEFGANKEPTQLAAALFNTLGALGVTYVQDPINTYQVTSNKVDYVDYIQYPRETIQRRSGDCDDLVALYSAALESLGIPTRVLLVPGHMLMMFATGVEASSDGYTMNDMYVVHEGMLWIPVEATLVGKSFIKAWETGAATYYREKGKEGFAVFDVHEAWEKFKPAGLPEDPWRAPVVGRDVIERNFPGDLLSVLKISSQTMTRRYLQAIQKNPSDMDAHLQTGIILARQGDRAEARKYFRKVVDNQPRNAAALNNLGNLHMLDSQYADAQKYYADAAKADPKDPEILVNLAQAYKAGKNVDKAKEAFTQAQKVDPAMANKYKALGLELLNAMSSSRARPAPAASREKK
ncbi:MAG: tetratricopeptide repeat protein [Burkholderiales bacterium]|nr:tetratricopeptide repeat protein [Burkholderiales bacterium]